MPAGLIHRILALIFATQVSSGLAGTALGAVNILQEVWDAEAAPGEGYDLVLDLDSLSVYTGGLRVTSGTNRLHGHGALLDLDGEAIRVLNRRTVFDIDGCVVVDGPVAASAGAIAYHLGASGVVANCVFYGNRLGIHMKEVNVAISGVINCIFMENSDWGVLLHDEITPPLTYCSGYRNGVGQPPGAGGDYGLWCGCGGTPPSQHLPPPEAECVVGDPLFVYATGDPLGCDFHLSEQSPCRGAGDPPGTHIGAYQEGAVTVEGSTWGGIKGLYQAHVRR